MRSLAVLLVLGLLDLHITSCLKICAFNVQSFGESKANNKKVMGILLKVLWAHCDQQPPQKNEQLMFLFFNFPRSSHGASCASFRRCEILKVKPSKRWWRI